MWDYLMWTCFYFYIQQIRNIYELLSHFIVCVVVFFLNQWVMVRKEKQGCCKQKKNNNKNNIVCVIDLREHTQRSDASTLKTH